MRKLAILSAFLCISVFSLATPDIEFSPSGPSGWSYDGVSTFTFNAQDIDKVLGLQTDTLYGQFVFLPQMTLSGYLSAVPGVGTGTLTPVTSLVEIKDGGGNVLLAGNLISGSYFTMFATSTAYPNIAMDMQITQINNTIGSAYLNTLAVGMYFDLNLSLQAGLYTFDQMITNNYQDNNGMSGSLTVPEPATLVLLSLGGLLFSRKK